MKSSEGKARSERAREQAVQRAHTVIAKQKTKKGAGGSEDAAPAAPATTGARQAELSYEEVVAGIEAMAKRPLWRGNARPKPGEYDSTLVQVEEPPAASEPEPVENRTMQVGTRYPVAMLEMIDQAVADAPAEFVTRADFIRRAVENELRRRALLPSYQEPRGPKPRKSAFA